jgi:hypothetical protein
MDRVEFFDPFAAENLSSATSTKRVPPVPAAPRRPIAEPAVPSRGREREMQQLIHDLAVLAAARSTTDKEIKS